MSDLQLALHDHPEGVETSRGPRVVYDLALGRASFGAASAQGHALRWELETARSSESSLKLAAPLELDHSVGWLIRCDRVDFPPGSIAHLHTHPGPGIRCLLDGELRVHTGGRTATYRPLEAWFESGPEPVLAEASSSVDTAFVRVMLLPREWAGKRTISYVNPDDAERPKLQRASIFFEEPIELDDVVGV